MIEFTVFMVAEDRLYRAEFAVGHANGNEFSIGKAEFHKSIKLPLNDALSRVAFQKIHHKAPVH